MAPEQVDLNDPRAIPRALPDDSGRVIFLLFAAENPFVTEV